LARRLLIDLSPTVGGHGARGIGRYVRGLMDSMTEWSPERQDSIWGLLASGSESHEFAPRIVTPRFPAVRADLGWLLGAMAVRRGIRESRAGVFHATDPHKPIVGGKTPQIVTAYDLIPLHEPETMRTWRPHYRHGYTRFLQQLRGADLIVAISKTSGEDVQDRLGIHADRVQTVYPVVNAPTSVVRAPSPMPEFLYVGALDAHKQPELAIEALANFRRGSGVGKLRFVGPADAERIHDLRSLASERGIANSVEFVGRIPDADLDTAFSRATALLFTSRVEGFGLPAVEALMRGIPVIAVDTPAARETLGGAATIVTQHSEAIAEAMSKPKAVSDATRRDLENRFSRSAAAEALWSAYGHFLE
jgi:glycosyltransferase involved in cell wall biosynthesis